MSMTKEQEEAIERLNKYLIADKSNIYTRIRVNDLETVLNMLKEKDKYIKDANDITTEMSNDIKKLILEIEKKDKMIDLMTKYWQSGLAICENCINIVENYDKEKCKQCIKQYFKRKVENE